MATGRMLRESLGPPIRVEPPVGGPGEKGLGGVRSMIGVGKSASSHGAARRRTHVLSKGPRTSGSIAGQGSRNRSSVYGQNAPSQPRKDPRPLSDKSYQLATIKKIIAFLADRNYGKTFTTKQLMQPSTKEFVHIFNFMVTLTDPSLEVNAVSIVEEIPKTLKFLGYGFTVSKNHMLNVGSPHSWPILLGALSWLVDCCNVPDRTTDHMFPTGTGFADDEEMRSKEHEYSVEFYMYDVYLQYGYDSDEYQGLMRQKEEAEREKSEKIQAEVSRVAEENEAMEESIAQLSQSTLPALTAKVDEDKKQLTHVQGRVREELPHSLACTEEDTVQLQEELSSIEMQIASSIEKAKDLELQIQQQPLSAKAARELRQSISDAEDSLGKHRHMQEQNSLRVQELQMQHNRSVGVIDAASRHANEKLHRLAAVLPDAASLPPLEYDTTQRADPEILHRLVTQTKTLRQEVQTLHQRVATQKSELESKAIGGESTQSTLHNEQIKKQLEIDNLQHSLSIEKGQLEKKKKRYEETIKTGQAELHALQELQLRLQQRMQEIPDRERELETVKREFDNEVRSLSGELEALDTQYEQYVVELTSVIDTAQNEQREYSRSVEGLVVQFNQLQLPSVPPHYLPTTHT